MHRMNRAALAALLLAVTFPAVAPAAQRSEDPPLRASGTLDCADADAALCDLLAARGPLMVKDLREQCAADGGSECETLLAFADRAERLLAAERRQREADDFSARTNETHELCIDCNNCENQQCCCNSHCECIAVFYCEGTFQVECTTHGGWRPCGWQDNGNGCQLVCVAC